MLQNDFASLGLPLFIIEQLKKLFIENPTPIQHQAIPSALAGEDVLASSQTGSGKTLAYVAPLIVKISTDPQCNGLILLPTREIALQVKEALEKIAGKSKEIRTVLLIGGESISKQMMQLRKRPNIMIGTPGRICDHLERKSLKLQQTGFLVLDEVDRMLDMGFSKPLKKICGELSQKRQTLMFSATLSQSIEEMAQQYLVNPKRIAVTSPLQPVPQIKQEIAHTSPAEKFPSLLKQLETQEGSVLIFVKTKRGAEELANKLAYNNHRVSAIHGDLQQSKRSRIMRAFRLENNQIMVATDIAARGLDVPHIALVINYDLPVCPEDYIHRIGRTGRAGASGRALSFITHHDTPQWKAIERFMNPGASLPDVPPHSLRKKSSLSKGKAKFFQKKPWSKESQLTRKDGRSSGQALNGRRRRNTVQKSITS